MDSAKPLNRRVLRFYPVFVVASNPLDPTVERLLCVYMMQFHFEFNEWEAAFDCFYEKHVGRVYPPENDTDQFYHREGDREYCLVISKDTYVSGYWVEKGAKPDDKTTVYTTLDQVVALHHRVIKAQDKATDALTGKHYLSIGGVVT